MYNIHIRFNKNINNSYNTYNHIYKLYIYIRYSFTVLNIDIWVLLLPDVQ